VSKIIRVSGMEWIPGLGGQTHHRMYGPIVCYADVSADGRVRAALYTAPDYDTEPQRIASVPCHPVGHRVGPDYPIESVLDDIHLDVIRFIKSWIDE